MPAFSTKQTSFAKQTKKPYDASTNKKAQYRFIFSGEKMPDAEYLNEIEKAVGGEKAFAQMFRTMWLNTTYKWNEEYQIQPTKHCVMIMYCEEDKADELASFLLAEGFSVEFKLNPFILPSKNQ